MLELLRYLNAGFTVKGVAYLGGTLVLGLLCVAFGFRLGR